MENTFSPSAVPGEKSPVLLGLKQVKLNRVNIKADFLCNPISLPKSRGYVRLYKYQKIFHFPHSGIIL